MADVGPIEPLWPRWLQTAAALKAARAHLRSRCYGCGALQRVDIDMLIARHGPAWSAIDALDRCTIVGCSSSVYYLARRGFDRPGTVLLRDPDLVETMLAASAALAARL